EAVAKLRVMHPVRLALIGEGPLERDLRKFAAELRIDDRVRFLGRQDDLAPWYSAMDVFVLPSLWEGLPNAVLEAMSAGLPVVATRVDGVPEAVDAAVTGLLCEPGDPQSLFGAIQEMIVDPEERHAMGAAGRKRAAENFRVSDMIAAYE